jgi:NAD+ diphosphatase
MPFTSDFQCYSGNPLDRAQIERRDLAQLDKLLTAPNSLFTPFQGDKPLIALSDTNPVGDIGWLALDDRRVQHIDRSAFHLLGKTADGHARFVCDIHGDGENFEAEAALFSDAGKFIDLRSVGMQGLISNPSLGILAQGKSMTSWHRSHQFCSTCGAVSVAVEGGIRRHCPGCKANHFPRTDPVVIMLIIDGDNCLLGRSANYNEGQYSTLAGFVDQGETVEEAVRREIKEETRIEVGKVSYFASQPWPFPSTLMIGCHGEALSYDIHIDDHEIEHARWFSRQEVHLMFDKTHPDGLIVPPKYAIAHHLIRHFADGEC